MKLRLIHTVPLITEVAEKMQPLLGFTRLQCFRLIIDINPKTKEALDASDEKCGNGIGVPVATREELRK